MTDGCRSFTLSFTSPVCPHVPHREARTFIPAVCTLSTSSRHCNQDNSSLTNRKCKIIEDTTDAIVSKDFTCVTCSPREFETSNQVVCNIKALFLNGPSHQRQGLKLFHLMQHACSILKIIIFVFQSLPSAQDSEEKSLQIPTQRN